MCICNRTMTVKSILICHSKFHWIPSSDCHAKGRIREEKGRKKKKMRTKAVFNWSTMFAKHVIKHLDAIEHWAQAYAPMCTTLLVEPSQAGPDRAESNRLQQYNRYSSRNFNLFNWLFKCIAFHLFTSFSQRNWMTQMFSIQMPMPMRMRMRWQT